MFEIEDFPRGRPKTDLFELIERQAEEHKVNLYIEEADLEDPDGHRFVYAFVGNRQAHGKIFPQQRYPPVQP